MSKLSLVVPAGDYLVAVSGGVDSIVLLNLLSKQKNLSLAVAHFDHGIRDDSNLDAEFVKNLSSSYGYPFYLGQAKLGAQSSEEEARKARYAYLEKIKNKIKADWLITAHHQDDEIETALINILRGTSSKGLTPMRANKTVLRPLLGFSKMQIVEYAKANKLDWREDPTNQQTSYLRNRIRHVLMPKINQNPELRHEIVQILNQSHKNTSEINRLTKYIYESLAENGRLRRDQFINLPHKVASELMAWWIKDAGAVNIDKKKINNLVVAAKTARPGSKHPVSSEIKMLVSKEYIQLEP